MAAVDAGHFRTAADDRIRIRVRLVAHVLGRKTVARHRRLSRRMAARPAAARQGLRRRSRPRRSSGARLPARAAMAGEYLALLAETDLSAPADEPTAAAPAAAFTGYLRACRADTSALSTLPPGRFLMPGDLEGSPALTFAPLPVRDGRQPIPRGRSPRSCERRYEAYKSRRGEAVLPRAFRAARPADRAGRRAAGAQCRARGGRAIWRRR